MIMAFNTSHAARHCNAFTKGEWRIAPEFLARRSRPILAYALNFGTELLKALLDLTILHIDAERHDFGASFQYSPAVITAIAPACASFSASREKARRHHAAILLRHIRLIAFGKMAIFMAHSRAAYISHARRAAFKQAAHIAEFPRRLWYVPPLVTIA